jgi:hypothetical protein
VGWDVVIYGLTRGVAFEGKCHYKRGNIWWKVP